jgi:hypothetical protein
MSQLLQSFLVILILLFIQYYLLYLSYFVKYHANLLFYLQLSLCSRFSLKFGHHSCLFILRSANENRDKLIDISKSGNKLQHVRDNRMRGLIS